VFDDTMKTGLNVALRQSPFLNVLSDSEVAKTLQQMTRPASSKLTPEVARELCLRAGSKAYIAGRVGSLGSQYVSTRAESLTQDMGKRFPLDTQMQLLWLPAIQAQLALNRKDPAPAVNALQAGSTIELGNIPFGNNISCLHTVYIRGEAYLATGQGCAAATEFKKILDHSGIVWNC
jgi:hypothetical protein